MSEEQKQTFDIESAYNETVNKDAVREATAFRTLPSGVYRFTPEKKEYVLAGEKAPWPGRRMVHVQYAVEALIDTVREDGSTFKPKGKMFVDFSIEDRWDDTKNGKRLDKPAALFNQAAKALGYLDKSKGEIAEALGNYPLNGYITEVGVLKGQGEGTKPNGQPKDKYTTIRTNVERKAALAEGAELSNFVQNVSEAK